MLHQARLVSGKAWSSAHGLGLTLTGAGTAVLSVVTLDHWRRARALARMKGDALPWCPPGLIASLLVILLGALLLVGLLEST